MNTTNLVMAIGLAAVLTIVTFVQLRKKEDYSTRTLIITCVLTFVLCSAAGYGVLVLMSNFSFFGN